jgi:hypothetical protein
MRGAGGIQRYLEAFPADGGFFAGANFVFDERVTVGGGSAEVVGRCCVCAAPHDAYEPRVRCARCRMLLLLCPACAAQVRARVLAPPWACQFLADKAMGFPCGLLTIQNRMRRFVFQCLHREPWGFFVACCCS